jgi:hypothetical protein
MNARASKSILATTAVVLFSTGVALAGFPGHHSAAGRSANVDFTETVQVPNGPTLQPGTYRVTLLNDSSASEIEFYRDGKLVGQAPVKLVDQGTKIRETQVFGDLQNDRSERVTEMDFSGWTQKVFFGQPGATSGSGE